MTPGEIMEKINIAQIALTKGNSESQTALALLITIELNMKDVFVNKIAQWYPSIYSEYHWA